jgi:hypothetical protein
MYSSPNIIRMIKLRMMRWAGHVVYVGMGGMHEFGGKVRKKETSGKT